ncbi:MAG TPA: isoprenylcysteine carboxylmethyltransferase family protein [Thermomicrobiales bacterium]|nr:isoprenylcysteine carboxylmethyltransferase family protein [Thermomicrobiales bacterium]
MITYRTSIIWSWAAFLLVWGVFAFGVKRDVHGPGYASALWRCWILRLAIAALIVVVAVRLDLRAGPGGGDVFSDGAVAFTPPPALGWIAAALTVIGIGFAIWARVCLGRNWSPRPAVKEQHELVTSGPYAFVRHPIYSGVVLAALGAALTGSVFGIVMFVLVCVTFLSRIGQEETIMRQLFPDQYAAYQARTKKLVPFVW